MLHDSQTDLVFLPMALRLHFPKLHKSLMEAFLMANIKCREIPYTTSKAHVWARDYMPITVDKNGDLAKFLYEPDYLQAPRYAKYKPDMFPIYDEMEMSPFRYEDITIDGGNILTDKQKHVYMTDKIFLENPHYPRKKLIAYLKQNLNARSIRIVHWDKSDIYGHVDGMMAIADDGALITDLRWEYLNFLRVGNSIFMAQLGEPSDKPALKRIREAFPDCVVFPIQHAQTLTKLGGGLHCATWNTVDVYYHNIKFFKTSKRHPFDPFDPALAFTDFALREVIEHYQKRKLQNDEWDIFNEGFKQYWNSLYWSDKGFSGKDMFNAIRKYLNDAKSTYFQTDKELTSVCDDLISYLMHIPGLIVPLNSRRTPQRTYDDRPRMWTMHLSGTVFPGQIISFKIELAYGEITEEEKIVFTKEIERQAQEAKDNKNGIIYLLYYDDRDNHIICPYRYEFIVRYDGRHLKFIMYWQSPRSNYVLGCIALRLIQSHYSFYENSIDEKEELPF